MQDFRYLIFHTRNIFLLLPKENIPGDRVGVLAVNVGLNLVGLTLNVGIAGSYGQLKQ